MKILCSRKNLMHEVRLIKDLMNANHRDYKVILLYNISVKNVAFFIFHRLIGFKLIWMRHEVTGFREKRLNNTLWYSIILVMVEFLLKLLSSEIFCANSTLASKHGYVHFPLPYKISPTDITDGTKRDIDILFFGRSDFTKSGALWQILEADDTITTLRAGGENFISESEKYDLFARSKFILNRYQRPFGQSGVTPDALSRGAAVITSEFDSLLSQDFGDYLIPIDSKLNDTVVHQEIKKLITNYDMLKLDTNKLIFNFERVWNAQKMRSILDQICRNG